VRKAKEMSTAEIRRSSLVSLSSRRSIGSLNWASLSALEESESDLELDPVHTAYAYRKVITVRVIVVRVRVIRVGVIGIRVLIVRNMHQH
jgi:hypothetical protein